MGNYLSPTNLDLNKWTRASEQIAQYQGYGNFNPGAYGQQGVGAVNTSQQGATSQVPSSGAQEPSLIESFFNALFGWMGGASTEDLEKATVALETLSAMQAEEEQQIDRGYAMHQAMLNDPTTKQYGQYDRELYPVNEFNTYALA
ncbi:MAG: hypothetical protein IJB79_06590 [Candidatus Gastranaerophilales bacterium]|nr:hypothetical protein [Candidatus Gastranaerophilales bacterium]